jgi:hypothetical protein
MGAHLAAVSGTKSIELDKYMMIYSGVHQGNRANISVAIDTLINYK